MDAKRPIGSLHDLSQLAARASSLRPRVLVAEDQPAMLALIARLLRDQGYEVVEISDGAILWDELRTCQLGAEDAREPDLIVSDVRMPGRSGLEVLALVRKSDWATPVILITAFGDRETHDHAYRLGAAQVFNKPFDLRHLIATARQLVPPT